MAVRFLQGVKFSGGTIRFADPVVAVPEVPFTVELITTTGAGTWTKPAGITEVVVECWGGGGAGGGATNPDSGGGGGAGGQYAKKTIIYGSAQQSIAYSVAASVAGTTGNGANGNDSTWNTNVVVAKGGQGGFLPIDLGGGIFFGEPGVGSTVGGIGDIVYAGGTGGGGTFIQVDTIVQGGGGGGGAGSTGNGGDATSFNGGIGASELGGNGGNTINYTPTTGGQAGNNGSNYGGAGSGAAKASGPNRSGGAGAQGLIRISYR